MSVQITINGDNATEAIQEFATLSAAFIGQTTAPVVEDPKPRQPRKAVEQPKKEEVKVTETGEEDPEMGQDHQPVGDAVDIPSVVDLRAVGQEKGKTAEGKKAIKALLDKFGSKSLSDVPEENRVAFMVGLEAI